MWIHPVLSSDSVADQVVADRTITYPETVMMMTLSADDRYLAIVSWKNELLVYDLNLPEFTPIIKSHHRFSKNVGEHCPKFNANGQQVTVEKDALVWHEMTTRKVVRRHPVGAISGYLVSSSDDRVVIAKPGGITVLTTDGEEYHVDQPCEHLAWLAHSNELLAAGPSPSVRCWNLNENSVRDATIFQSDGYRSLAASSDGRMIAAQGYDKQVRVWSWLQPDQAVISILGTDQSDRGSFRNDSNRFLIRRSYRDAQVYSTTDFQPIGPPLRPPGRFLEAIFHPTSDEIIVLSQDQDRGIVSFLNPTSGETTAASITIEDLPSDPTNSWRTVIATDVQGQRLAVLGRQGKATLIDLKTQQIDRTIDTEGGVSLTLLDASSLLLTWRGTHDESVVAYSLVDGAEVYRMKDRGALPGFAVADWRGLFSVGTTTYLVHCQVF